MQKTSALSIVAIVIIVALIVVVNITFHSFKTFLMSKPDIIQEVDSPDGKYVAYLFESNAGATTKFTYRLSILRNGKQLKSGDIGNTFISYDEFDVGWVDNNTLKVNNANGADILRQEKTVSGIVVNYNYIKE